MRACSGDICSFIMLPNWNVMPQPQVMTPQSTTIQGHRSDLSLCFYCLCSAKPSRPTTITNSVYLGLIHRKPQPDIQYWNRTLYQNAIIVSCREKPGRNNFISRVVKTGHVACSSVQSPLDNGCIKVHDRETNKNYAIS